MDFEKRFPRGGQIFSKDFLGGVKLQSLLVGVSEILHLQKSSRLYVEKYFLEKIVATVGRVPPLLSRFFSTVGGLFSDFLSTVGGGLFRKKFWKKEKKNS